MRKSTLFTVCAITLLSQIGSTRVAHAADAEAVDRRGLQLGLGGVFHEWAARDELGQYWTGHSMVNGFGPLARIGWRFLPWLGVEAEGVLLPTKGRDDGIAVLASGIRASGVLWWDLGDWQPFFLAGMGSSLANPSAGSAIFVDQDTVSHVGIGVEYEFSHAWGARADIRSIFLPAIHDGTGRYTMEVEGQLALTWRPFAHAPVADAAAGAADAAPVGPPDADGDGIPDDVDVCPWEPETRNGIRDADGCPEADAVDAPRAATPANGAAGARPAAALPPPEARSDPDGDGFFGDDDLCPNAAEDKDGFADGDGCPDPDNDQDGIPDSADKCPLVAETFNGFEDNDGCPDEVPATVAKFTGRIEGITFAPNQDLILKQSNKVLLAVVKVLQENPSVRLRIEGHTDDRGDAQKNTELSQRRADAVRAWLLAKGLAPSRLEAKGYGPSKPLADNATAAGRGKNRRVEFHLLLDDAAPSGQGGRP